MTDNPLLDHIQTGNTTYDLVSREVKNNNAASAQTNLKIWSGTHAQYSTITNRDAATVYNFTDVSPNQLSYISNCLTEIPQDLAFTLSNGTVTLLSGSKAYYPDGQDTFTPIITESDLTLTTSYSGDKKLLICLSYDGSTIYESPLENCVSDASATTTDGFAYDITTNKIGHYLANGTLDAYCTLPLAIITIKNGDISEIDSIFNGFGYIGTTLFVLPGVSGLIPNGRNKDGSLKSILFSYTSVKTLTTLSTGDKILALGSSDISEILQGIWTYNSRTNYFENSGGATSLHVVGVYYKVMNDGISVFSPEMTFHAAQYSGGTTLQTNDLLDNKWADHLLANQSWLRADTFSWHDGDEYLSVYDHLVADINNINPTTETVGSYTITYYPAADGHKVVTFAMESTVQDIYNETGSAWYYILDTINKRFKLPRNSHGDVVEKYKSGTEWYRVYSDGWCEQGGFVATTATPTTVNLLKEYVDTNYSIELTGAYNGNAYPATSNNVISTDSFQARTPNANVDFFWQTKGYITTSLTNDQYKYLYFYTGPFSQSAIEQTAGLNTELFNEKMDLDMSNMNPSQTAKQTIVGLGIPDYTAGVTISSPYTATEHCFVSLIGHKQNASGDISVSINGTQVSYFVNGNSNTQGYSSWFYLAKGDTITYSSTRGFDSQLVFPLKGVQNA